MPLDEQLFTYLGMAVPAFLALRGMGRLADANPRIHAAAVVGAVALYHCPALRDLVSRALGPLDRGTMRAQNAVKHAILYILKAMPFKGLNGPLDRPLDKAGAPTDSVAWVDPGPLRRTLLALAEVLQWLTANRPVAVVRASVLRHQQKIVQLVTAAYRHEARSGTLTSRGE